MELPKNLKWVEDEIKKVFPNQDVDVDVLDGGTVLGVSFSIGAANEKKGIIIRRIVPATRGEYKVNVIPHGVLVSLLEQYRGADKKEG